MQATWKGSLLLPSVVTIARPVRRFIALCGVLLALCLCPVAAAQEVYGPPDELAVAAVPEPESILPAAIYDGAIEQAAATPEDEPRRHIAAKRERRAKNRRAMIPGIVISNVLDVADIVTTHRCSRRPNCEEFNSLYGSDNPSLKTILALKGAEMAFSTVFALLVGGHEPAMGYAFLSAKGIVTGKNVVGNIRLVF